MRREFSHFTVVHCVNEDSHTNHFAILNNDGEFITFIAVAYLSNKQINAFMNGTEDEVVNAINTYVQEQLHYAYKLASKFNLEI